MNLTSKSDKFALRPQLPKFSPQTHDLIFQLFHIEASNFEPEVEDKSERPDINFSFFIYGLTGSGHSLFVQATGYRPRFHVSIPEGEAWGYRQLENLKFFLVSSVRTREGNVFTSIVQGKEKLIGYSNHKKYDFVKIECSTTAVLKKCIEVLKKTTRISGLTYQPLELFNTNVDNILYFCHDNGLTPSSWVRLSKGTYTLDNPGKRVNSQLDIQTHWKSFKPVVEREMIAPFLLASFDIEVCSSTENFPDATVLDDKIIQISTVVQRWGEEEVCLKHCVSLHETTNTLGNGNIVESVESEEELLFAWKRLMVDVIDPDVITGYNIDGFDLAYIYNRATLLNIDEHVLKLGRQCWKVSQLDKSTFYSSAYGFNEFKRLPMSGRITLDTFWRIKQDHKLKSYKLNDVAFHFLKEKKEDVHYTEITPLFHGTKPGISGPDGRMRLAKYCIQDSVLPIRILLKTRVITDSIEMSRVGGVPLQYVFQRGQQIKVYSTIIKKCLQKGYMIQDQKLTKSLLLNYLVKSGMKEDIARSLIYEEEEDEESSEVKPKAKKKKATFQGATVLTAKVGAHFDPIVTMDFASLYPSIMRGYELCYCNVILDDSVEVPSHLEVETLTLGDGRVCKIVQETGIIPTILTEFVSARKRVKRMMAEETDLEKKDLLNSRQLALKVLCNSVYGFSGTRKGYLPFMILAELTTLVGRKMIETTQTTVIDHYPGSEIIYGDTDSVMVNFHIEGTNDEECLKEAFRIGEECAAFVTKKFKPPNELEMEKIYRPYLLFNKKRYAGLKYESYTDTPTQDMKGIAIVRRDVCNFTQTVMRELLDILLNSRDVKKAQDIARNHIKNLLDGKVCDKDLTICKLLSKKKYEGSVPHAALATKLMLRDKNTAPSVGDRVDYVIVKQTENITLLNNVLEFTAPSKDESIHIEVPTGTYTAKQLSKALMTQMNTVEDGFNVYYEKNKFHFQHGLPFRFIIASAEYKNRSLATTLGWPAAAPDSDYQFEHITPGKFNCNLKQFQLVEDPKYVKDNDMELDYYYYYEHQLYKPMYDLFQLIMPKEAEEFFNSIRRNYENKMNNYSSITTYFTNTNSSSSSGSSSSSSNITNENGKRTLGINNNISRKK